MEQVQPRARVMACVRASYTHFLACCSVRYRGNVLCGIQPLAGASSSLSSVADGLTVCFLFCLLVRLLRNGNDALVDTAKKFFPG